MQASGLEMTDWMTDLMQAALEGDMAPRQGFGGILSIL